MPNRLANCSSPYLRQHADNPVDWYPWDEEAFAKARAKNLPIFLSVGYAACHWCHVMEHESFENEDIAKILNDNFVSIKVDREERPDVDQVYMQAVQMMTGSGGWPMSVFMNPAGEPFFAGTYWPPVAKYQRPGFDQVLLAVLDAWKNKSEQLAEQGKQVVGHLQQLCNGPAATSSEPDPNWVTQAVEWLVENHDETNGGFGGTPKFPHAMDLSLMLEYCSTQKHERALNTVTHTLDKMFQGGIYDHLAGGFARYSVDAKWLVPHFEKMLYDNALLTVVYSEAYRQTKNENYLEVVQQTLNYVINDMTHPDGGFYSTEDADSEGVEGKFYVWTPKEIEEVLGPADSQRFCDVYDVSESGNFEGKCILNLPVSLADYAHQNHLDLLELKSFLAGCRKKLLSVREKRVRPGLDDKVLLSWNALMITAMCRGYRATGDLRFKNSAIHTIGFIKKNMRRQDGRFWHCWRNGEASIEAFLDDMSYLLDALCELYQVEAEASFLELAIEIAHDLRLRFAAPEGGFYFTADDQEKLIARSKDLADSSVPSGNAMAALSLVKLAQLTGENSWLDIASGCLTAASGILSQSPQAAGQSLRALMRISRDPQEYVLVLPQSLETGYAEALRQKVFSIADPCSLTVISAVPNPDEQTAAPAKSSPLLANRLDGDEPTLYICKNHSCQKPILAEEILALN